MRNMVSFLPWLWSVHEVQHFICALTLCPELILVPLSKLQVDPWNWFSLNFGNQGSSCGNHLRTLKDLLKLLNWTTFSQTRLWRLQIWKGRVFLLLLWFYLILWGLVVYGIQPVANLIFSFQPFCDNFECWPKSPFLRVAKRNVFCSCIYVRCFGWPSYFSLVLFFFFWENLKSTAIDSVHHVEFKEI